MIFPPENVSILRRTTTPPKAVNREMISDGFSSNFDFPVFYSTFLAALTPSCKIEISAFFEIDSEREFISRVVSG